MTNEAETKPAAESEQLSLPDEALEQVSGGSYDQLLQHRITFAQNEEDQISTPDLQHIMGDPLHPGDSGSGLPSLSATVSVGLPIPQPISSKELYNPNPNREFGKQ